MTQEQEKKPENTRDKKKARFNEFFSIFDAEGERLMNAATNLAPAWMRSEIFTRALGPIGAWIESKSDSLENPLLAAAVEKASDLIEDFGHGLRGGKPKTVATEEKKVIPNWVDNFKKNAYERFQNATDPSAELEKLKNEFLLRIQLAEFIDAQTKTVSAPDNTPTHKPIITKEDMIRFKEHFKRSMAEVNASFTAAATWADQTAASTAARIETENVAMVQRREASFLYSLLSFDLRGWRDRN